ncbi:NADH:ubiquinone oxidoreductase subunit NDUFA12 [Falsiroseomonas sp. CW058]|uniref:NADH:ubiquinone oxidoreductase subunit NDUFA12 n=1 Tax=Falsiroseomonas sp. CW058 TaxID=3388664 RepID=UPI003D31F3BC
MLKRFFAGISGRKVGQDRFGNTYYESRGTYMAYGRTRRWVLYVGGAEATKVPPEWHAWLHHTTDAPLPEAKRHPWMVEHRPNPTGTANAYRPVGHDYVAGRRAPTTGDYEAWTPGS